MRQPNSRQEIVQQNQTILSKVNQAKVDKRRVALRGAGHVLFAEAKDQGFKKIGFDVFQRNEDKDAGNIWSVENIGGEDWLVCYTDQQDNILRGLKAAAMGLTKTASIEKEAIVMNAGDLVEVTPRHRESVHNKYKGKRGEVTAADPVKSQLTFDDGTSFWIENTDLTTVKDAKELSVGDNVRMFSRKNTGGKVTRFSHNNAYVHFEGAGGQQLTARITDICKVTKMGITIQNITTDPNDPGDAKMFKDYMKGAYPVPPMDMPDPSGMGEATPSSAGMGMDSPSGMRGMPDAFPPSIKANPSSAEMSAGTSMPASQFANAEFIGFVKRGRQLNIGDQVQKKSTGEQGTIIDVSFDRKLGKFYMIDFGAQDPALLYDTDIMKMKPGQGFEAPVSALPMDASPVRQSSDSGPQKTAVLGPEFDSVKASALDFVEGMVSQALRNHETESPGVAVAAELENTIVKQAITLFMGKYLPVEMRQALSSEDKNELSEWLYTTAADEAAEAPTTEDFAIVEPKPEADPWDLQGNHALTQADVHSMAVEKLSYALNEHIPIVSMKPTEFGILRDKQKFIHDAVNTMARKCGMPIVAAHLIADHTTSFPKINWNILRRGLAKLGYKHVEQLLETAGDVFAFTVFETATGQKFALDLPGMETLRGGGGGYPGGMDVDPMGWEVKNPGAGDADPNMLQNALQENLADQSIPFEEAAPKINIELDPENKKITIDYDQEEAPPIELAGAEPGLDGGPNPGQSPPGPGPQPGQVGGSPQAPDGGAADLSGMDVPTNF